MGRFDNKLILITGASAGIGRATAQEFVREGARVIGTGRNQVRLNQAAAELGKDSFIPLLGDVADVHSMAAMATKVLSDIGVPDIVIANAGIGYDAHFIDTGEEAWHEVFETNVFGVVRTIRPFLPRMMERGSGRVVLISSVVGKRGIPHYAAYSASKFALDGMADVLRVELVGSGVSLGTVYPSSTESEFQDRTRRVGLDRKPKRPTRHSTLGVARAIVGMADSKRTERLLSFEGNFMTLADKVSPRLVDWILSRVLKRRKTGRV
jgi:NAD(P)-dependent dehydrogenase (short-subunit alcohol dehydrogenase family)